jgi:2-polyprenyl-6-methoxyphenol hydroxylase-like FAD-dependent oxidoreductase
MPSTAGDAAPPSETSVIIVGGGPCGLMLAIELARRNVRAVLVDEKSGTAINPQANATQARTMEHYRRLGFADEIRALGMPPDFPTDIAYFTRFAGHELARFRLPSAREAKQRVAKLSGSWSAAELPHRISQKLVERVLRRHAENSPTNSINFGWRLIDFEDRGGHVTATIERLSDGFRQSVRGAYLVGADGARSLVRQKLGFRYAGESGVVRDFMGGRMYAIYLRAPDFYRVVPHAPAWMNVTVNRDRRAFMAAVDGKAEFAFHTQLRAHENENRISDADAKTMFRAAVGRDIDIEIIDQRTWTAGYALVSEHFAKGRVFLGGDAAHLFTPAGGLGYNTAVDDAVNLGWKLAATLRGQGGPALLASYEAERRPLAIRNTSYARGFADSLGTYEPPPAIADDGAAGEAARRDAGAYYDLHARAEFNIPGVTFGGRYDASPVIASDGTRPPPDAANSYVPTACPGGRAPHLWLGEGQSLYDSFGPEWTLLRLGPGPADAQGFARAASALGLDLRSVDVPTEEARDLYEADLALVRPDQMVAWRGHGAANAPDILARVTGRQGRGPTSPSTPPIGDARTA